MVINRKQICSDYILDITNGKKIYTEEKDDVLMRNVAIFAGQVAFQKSVPTLKSG